MACIFYLLLGSVLGYLNNGIRTFGSVIIIAIIHIVLSIWRNEHQLEAATRLTIYTASFLIGGIVSRLLNKKNIVYTT